MQKKPLDLITSQKNISLFIFFLVLIVFGYFFRCGGWNQNARYDAIFAFVEPGTSDYHTFHIDRFVANPKAGLTNTGDWAYYNGHFYSNKAPGTTLIGIPIYTVIFHFEQLLGISWNHPYIEILNAYLLNFFLSIIPAAFGIVFFYKLMLLYGNSSVRAASLSLILAFATFVFPYSTSLWGHVTAMSFIIFSLYCIEKKDSALLFFAGLFAGLATLTDYLAILPTLFLGILVLWRDKRKLLFYIAGGIPSAIILLLYNNHCFGSPFAMSSSYSAPGFINPEKFLGLFGLPDLRIIFELTFGLRRGIFLAAPILLFAIPALYFLVKQKKEMKQSILIACCTVISFILVNASFNGWHGGHSIFSRYQIVALPFWILIASLLPNRNKWNILLLIVVLFSIFNMFAATAVCHQMPTNPNPLYDSVYQHLFRGELDIVKYPIRLQKFNPDLAKFVRFTSLNAGELIGL